MDNLTPCDVRRAFERGTKLLKDLAATDPKYQPRDLVGLDLIFAGFGAFLDLAGVRCSAG